MRLRGYITVYNHCDERTGFFFYSSPPNICEGSKTYTFTIDIPHNLPELKTVENLEEVKND